MKTRTGARSGRVATALVALALGVVSCREVPEADGGGTRGLGEDAGDSDEEDTSESDTGADTDTTTLPDEQVAVRVSGGYWHTCALDAGGGLKCWGANYHGELGDGEIQYLRLMPERVIGLESGVVDVAAGGENTCALTAGGGVKCWGHNSVGQLGNGEGGSVEDCETLPVDVVGLGSGMAGFAATGGVACAWTAAGAASCWGYDECGMLGDGQGGDCDNATDPWVYSPVPSPVVSIPGGVADIALGGTACAVSADGGAWCWGWNPAGQLGLDCAEPFSAVPVPIAGLESGVADVAVGNEHVCALTDAGGVKCWGSNQRGQLGDGQAPTCYDPENPTPPSAVPVDVSGLQSGVVAIDAGFNHTCALTVDGAVLCWGENEMGQIGNGDDSWCNDLFPDQHDVPVPDAVVELDAPIVSLSCGWWHSCAVDDQGGILCWGMGGFGQLGNLHTTYHWLPVRVVGYGGY